MARPRKDKEESAVMKKAYLENTLKKMEIENEVEALRVRAKLPPPKCISDKILLYTKYGLDRIGKGYLGDGLDYDRVRDYDSLVELCLYVYENHIRGEMRYTNMKPDTVAACLIYVCGISSGYNGHLNQDDVSKIYGIKNETIRRHYKQMAVDIGALKDDIFSMPMGE